MNLRDLELSVRAENCLLAFFEDKLGRRPTCEEITIDAVCHVDEADLRQTRGYGLRSHEELCEALARLGRRIGDGRSEDRQEQHTPSGTEQHPLHSAIAIMHEHAKGKRAKLITALQNGYAVYSTLRLALDELEQYEKALELMRRQVGG